MKFRESKPLALGAIQVTDGFWKREMELVRREIIPYQWNALNDRVEGAEPSFCMRNFRVAVRQNQQRSQLGSRFEEPQYTFRGFQSLPEDPDHLEDKFYGFVFQDSDFYKWVESVAYSLVSHPDPQLEQLADEAIELVCQAQQEDGYLDTYYIINGKDKIFTNLRDHHELYCFGHLTEGAVAYYQATGKDQLLNAARRFADYIDAHFGPEEGKCKGYPGHEIAEMALVRLYEATGEERYLKLSRFFVEERGRQPYYFETEEHPNETNEIYHQSHLPVRKQEEPVGHAVRAVYLYSGMADLARLYQDESMFAACDRLWDNMVSQKLYITGAIGATHIGESFSFPFDLPNDTAYAETCASIGLVFFARRMLQMKPDVKYSDVMELALYNGILSGMALDGKSFFYVNPLEVDPKACALDFRKEHVKPVRQKWFGCACCPPNLARLLGSIGEYAYTEDAHTLYVHLYIGGEAEKCIADEAVRVHIASGFPWDGRVTVTVGPAPADFELALRIPGWCGEYEISGTEGMDTQFKDGYLFIRGAWDGERVIELNFPMEIRAMEASSRVREDIGKVAVMRGPVVYCLEERDNGADLHLLSVDCRRTPELMDASIEGTPIKAIEIAGERMISDMEGAPLYHAASDIRTEPVTLHFIPYYTWANRGENEMQVWVRRIN